MKTISKQQVILDHLQKHGRITTWEGMGLYGQHRLSGKIHQLRKMGYKIENVDKLNVLTDEMYTEYRFVEK